MSQHKPSLRQQFLDAFNNSAEYKRQEMMIEQGHKAGLKEFYARFDEIADNLKDQLQDFVIDVADGKTALQTAWEAYKYDRAPLKFEIPFPAVLTRDQTYAIEDNLEQISGYQKILAICAGKDVDMDIITSHRGTAYTGSDGERVGYNSILIQIMPGRPYSRNVEPAQQKPKI